MRRVRLVVDRWSLEYDRDYGVNKRAGWSASVGGSYVAQLTSLWRAVRALVAVLL